MKYLLLTMCLSIVFLGGCATERSCIGNYLHYEYAAQVLAMPSCKATNELLSPCEDRFRTEGGRVFIIGGPGADQEIRGFLGTLEEGKSYYLPKAFMEFLKENKKKTNPN